MASKSRTADAGHATPEDVEQAIRRLTDNDYRHLGKVADYRSLSLMAIGLGWSGDDLLQEAITRTLEGDRKWPRGVSLMAHLWGTMRSIASHVPDELKGGKIETATTDDESRSQGIVLKSQSPDQEVIAAAQQRLAIIENRFADDDGVALVIEGLASGMTGPEIQEALGITQREYETRMTRLRRGIERTEEWRP
jgi:DNA-directed RNA polymerase specialized sigma24 family protein